MTICEWYRAFCARIPEALCAPWDNDGLMCASDLQREVDAILFSLDVTDAVVDRAIETGAQLIVSHHPLIFSPLRALTPEDAVSRRVLKLLLNGISVFSFHTRLDAVTGGINDALAEMLLLEDVAPLGEGEASLGRIGMLRTEMPLGDFCTFVKDKLGAPALNVSGAHRPVKRVALVGGEGKDFIGAAVFAGADTYLSGRLGYHAMQDIPLTLIEAGHFYTEKHAAELLCAMARELAPDVKTEIYTQSPMTLY